MAFASIEQSLRLAPPAAHVAHRASEQARLGTSLKRVICKHMANAQLINIETSPDNYPVTSTSQGGIHETKPSVKPQEYTIPELMNNHGMRVVQWDGCLVSSLQPLVDKEKGHPNDTSYLGLTQDTANKIEMAYTQLRFRPDQQGGCRGAFSLVSMGISFGGGQQALPMTHPALCCNFKQHFSAFAAATINFGPSTITLLHIDALNLAWGWCSITTLETFDPDLGSYLVPQDL
ncbi:hypothetical protein B0H14DRAFT_2577095 [Mycena olivaceomarginata]|nr:hypothetical protein B0H14DRAFT_2577095 [Mycena olivaceomarginata]